MGDNKFHIMEMFKDGHAKGGPVLDETADNDLHLWR